MADSYFPEIDEDVRQRLLTIATCRKAECPVVQRHPFYPTPHQPPFYYGKRPCLPVVPTYVTKGKIMLIGEYPNTRYGHVVNANPAEEDFYPPVADINEPFETGRYFDTVRVRLYPTGQELYQRYLEPLGIRLEDAWLTNINKCFLLGSDHITRYQKAGWVNANQQWVDGDTGQNQTIAPTVDDYFDVAAVCVREHLLHELALCQPKLIIAFGSRAYRMIHSNAALVPPAMPSLFGNIIGLPMRANVVSHPTFDLRQPPFSTFNVIHLYHPSTFTDDPSASILQQYQDSLPPTLQFMQELGLA